MSTSPEFPITTDEFFSDPFPTLRRMREQRPVYYHPPLGVWFLARYDHCDAVVCDRRFVNFRARELLETLMPALRGTPDLEGMVAQWSRLLWFIDPPQHTRSRAMISRGFSAAGLARVRPDVRAIVRGALARVADGGGELDVVWDLSDRLSLDTICVIFDIPEADRPSFRRWTSDVLQAAGAGATTEDASRSVKESSASLFGYLSDLVKHRAAHPGDDMVSRFLGGEGNDPAVVEEVAVQCVQMIGAGYLTVRNQIGNAVVCLLRFPDELTRLRRDPALLRPAIEEVLRFEPSVLTTNRLAGEDVEIGGERIERGTLVFPVLSAANRDPAVFPDPDRFDIGRQGGRQMTFGFGPHYCIGGALVRLEMEEALKALLDFDQWELAGPYDYRGANLQDRGPSRLPLRLSRPRHASDA